MPASDERDATVDVTGDATANVTGGAADQDRVADKPGTEAPATEAPATEAPAATVGPRFRVRPVVRPSARDDDSRVESVDETGEGWGDAPDRRGDDWYRRERPPHHGS